MKKESIKAMCLTSVFTAIIFIFTAYFHIPVHMGYTHLGDGFIYLAACILPLPYALFASACGALLADCLTGFAVFAPASVIIKALTVTFFYRKNQKIICTRNLLALIPSFFICVIGYYTYEVIITQNFISSISGVFGNIIQSIFSSSIFIFIGFTLDSVKTGNHLKINK